MCYKQKDQKSKGEHQLTWLYVGKALTQFIISKHSIQWPSLTADDHPTIMTLPWFTREIACFV
jgi:hypothetical protein